MTETQRENPRSRLLVVDAHTLTRAAVKAILEEDAAIEMVGEAHDGEEGLRRCRELRPDLVLMDVCMPKMGGIEATSKIKTEFPSTSVLILTAQADHRLLLDAVRVGVAGYVLKGPRLYHVLDAVRAVLNGETFLDQGLAMRLLRCLAEEATARVPTAALSTSASEHATSSPSPLTARETEVLGRLILGETNRQIAAELHISLSTVKRHLEHVLAKLGVSDRTQAAMKAVELGLFLRMRPEERDA